jgi:hypothetical protein
MRKLATGTPLASLIKVYAGRTQEALLPAKRSCAFCQPVTGRALVGMIPWPFKINKMRLVQKSGNLASPLRLAHPNVLPAC